MRYNNIHSGATTSYYSNIVLHYLFLISLTTSFRIVFTEIMVYCSCRLSIKSFGVEQVGVNGFIMTRCFLVYTLSAVRILQKFSGSEIQHTPKISFLVIFEKVHNKSQQQNRNFLTKLLHVLRYSKAYRA